MESYLRMMTLKRAPRCSRDAQVPSGWTQSTGQARMQLKAITREDCVDACCGCTFFSGFWMHAYSLDMWMFNFIIHDHINFFFF